MNWTILFSGVLIFVGLSALSFLLAIKLKKK